jgi:hypothetical protein
MTAPRYPNYPSQPFTGDLPSMAEVGPSDLRYSSGTAPVFQTQLDRAHGRWLAGPGNTAVQDENSVPASAVNELALLSEADDVRGNGVFDPQGTEREIHPDAGIFATHYDFPGYLARERTYAKSEVLDATTGRPVVFVNSGAVSMDSAAQVAYLEKDQYGTPTPLIRDEGVHRMPPQSTVNVRVRPDAIGAIDWTPWKWIGASAALGLAVGAVVAMFKKKKG